MSIFIINFFQLQMKCTPCIMWIIANVVENPQCLQCVCVYLCIYYDFHACDSFCFCICRPFSHFWSTISLFVAATDSRKTSTTTTRAHQDINVYMCVCVWVSASTFMYIYNRYHTDMHMSSRQRQQLRLLQRCTVGPCTQNSWQKMQRYAELCWQLLGYNNVYMYS